MNDIILKYLQGNASEKEKELLLVWLRADEENKKTFSEIRDRWLESDAAPVSDPELVKRAFKRFTTGIEAKERARRQRRLSYYMKVAASVAILLVCSLGGYFTGQNQLFDSSIEEQLIMNRVIMGKGSKGSVTLPDGTTAWLNANSMLIYPEQFTDNKRSVKLEGEGYFEVVRNTGSPFIVYTPDDEQVEVLGTKFYVEAYSGTKKFETALIEGSVRVRAANSQFILQPSYKAVLKGGKMSVEKITDFDIYRWREGLICFKNRHFSEILEELKKYYGVHIRFDAAKINNPVLTVKFRLSDGIEYALRVLQKDVKFKYVRNDEENTFVIK